MKETRLKRLRQKAADLRKTADRLFRAGDPAGAAAAYRRQARVLHTCGEMRLAAEACRRAVALNPGDSRAHCERGLALQALGRLQAAGPFCPGHRHRMQNGPDRPPDSPGRKTPLRRRHFTGDVLIYMGDLDGVFKSVKSCCKPGGVFVFSVEERGTSG